jgi:hypothetical protein
LLTSGARLDNEPICPTAATCEVRSINHIKAKNYRLVPIWDYSNMT